MATKSGVAGPVMRLEFRYDYMGRRIRKNVYNAISGGTLQESRVYLYEGWNLIAEFDGSQSNALLRTYTWGLDLSGSRQGAGGTGGLLIVQDHEGASPENHFAAYDGNGNVVGLIDSVTGEKSATYEYSPFGELIRVSGEMGMKNTLRYSSRYTDDETGLLYYGYRYYSPALGKWLSPDPIEESGGMNVFGFLGNDPVNAVDVLGMFITGVGYNRPNWWQTPPDTRTEYEKALDAIKELELAEWMTWQTIDMLAGEEGVKALLEGKIFFGVVIFGKDFVIGKVTKIFRLGKGLANKAYELCCTNIRAKLSKVKAFLVEKTGIKRLCSNASNSTVNKNSRAYKGESHVYEIRAPDGSVHKIGKSSTGTRRDGQSKRAESQVRKLNRQDIANGGVGGYESNIRKTFASSAEALDYESALRDRYRRMFGQDLLPGNLEHLRGRRKQ